MEKEKSILCDSSALISLTSSCLVKVLYAFSKQHNVKFVIPKAVVDEIITRPLQISMKAYKFSALRLKKTIRDKILVTSEIDVSQEATKLLNIANSIFFAKGKPLHLIDRGEAEMIILASRLGIKALLMDERTTRMLIETPFVLKEHLKKELKVSIMINQKNYDEFAEITKGMQVIRSSDLLAVSNEIGYFSDFAEDSYEAFASALYSLKYSGCSIGFFEIEDFVNGRKNEPRTAKR